jgi:hypothetical protein
LIVSCVLAALTSAFSMMPVVSIMPVNTILLLLNY